MNTEKRKVALVTGASRNIGRAIAVRLAQDGCDVVVHVGQDLSAGEESANAVRAAGARAEVMAADLRQKEAITGLAQAAGEAFGRLDIIVNNAAIRPETPFADLTLEAWRDVMSVCLEAPFLLCQAVLPYLSRSPCGRIVNIGGLTAHTGAEGRAHIITAKAGLVGLTKALAHELAGHGICVNCVSPGLIETKRVGASPAHHTSRRNLLGWRGLPDDVADAVAYLSGPTARYVTGQTLHVSGGAFLP
ncbi:SDR family NAD(P)-dependent oxidoreductase [Paracoccus beibuensis]|uniref:SDR family NAD(P)-dependent oxidoreductase n=1 Tax=Paracoccus beibuensis TaxID=547602 RepID=UPI0022403C97|nr:SDR family oxidoreductase [Paracoccus beibuensis]